MVNSAQGLTDQSSDNPIAWEQNAASTSPEVPANDLLALPARKGPSGKHWQAQIVSSIDRLLRLPENWNSYGAPRIRHDTAMFAIVVLENIMIPGTPLPSVVPTTQGGIQFEWHENDIDFEIDVIEPYHCEFTFHDERNNTPPVEGELDNELIALEEPISLLTQRNDEQMFALRRA
ncbi:MAG: hypothetical protein HYY28_07785 [Betaproteobacteria bacterium]|nr:hypothetical protein [Betaproteobacteria bacterium]